jgi:pimeloyl-ACP methyl ester carboxylesterase
MRSQVPALVAWIFCSAIGAASADEPLRLADCRLESTVAGGSVAARCGHYRVRENRDDPHDNVGKELQLHVAIIPALRLKPAADPLFILSGGPGQAASDFYLSVAPAFSRIRRDRDLVLIDQRGTGRSNALQCTMPDDTGAFDPQKVQAAVRECLASLPGDPRYYTTSIAVRDLDDVRAALGYRKVNLYGISYGTRVAQHYMRRYPDRVRRGRARAGCCDRGAAGDRQRLAALRTRRGVCARISGHSGAVQSAAGTAAPGTCEGVDRASAHGIADGNDTR